MVKIATQRVTLQVSDGSSMSAYVARPAEEGKFPAMLVLQEAFGVNAHIRDFTERIAREGYVAVAPELFHRSAPGFEGTYDNFPAVMPHMQALTLPGQTADIRAAYDWLLGREYVSANKIGSIGFCMGGRASFLACATLPLQASISFYGGGIAPGMLPGLLDRAGELHAPILLFWGGLDQHIKTADTRAVEDALLKAGKKHVNVTISYADHGFFCDARASYNAEAAGLAWKLSLQFLEMYLKSAAERAHA
jgi:carboxymethylenebutenolidase